MKGGLSRERLQVLCQMYVPSYLRQRVQPPYKILQLRNRLGVGGFNFHVILLNRCCLLA
uniref:Similar to ATVPS33 (Arabidopsis thaliana vacuolar protein sorting 33) n=1 Tax=Arundo donax TaxID=35708 RepID=A0A0A9AMH1_ARUDO